MKETFYQNLLIFGHRGASARAPENTLAAFRLAANLGADGVECDVQLSRDGYVVICHDETIDRTTDGSGPVRCFTLAELQTFDAGAWFGPAFAGEHIPTLQEAIDQLGDQLLFNIELKSTPLHAHGRLEEAVAKVVQSNSLHDRVIVSSFDPFALRRLHHIDRRIHLGLLYAPKMPLIYRKAWLRWLAPCQAMHPHHTLVNPSYMQWARRNRYRVNTWTVDEPAEMRRLVGLGVNCIITNRPDVLREALGSN